MKQNAFGLIDRELIRQFSDRWNRGGVGVLHVKLPAGGEAAARAVKDWMDGNSRLFWYSRMGSEWFFFLQRLSKEERLSSVLAEAERALRDAIADSSVGTPVIGSASSRPSGTGRSAETTLYHAVKEALRNARKAHRGVAFLPGGDAGFPVSIQSGTVGGSAIGQLAAPIPMFPREALVSEVADLFETNPLTQGAVIVEGDRPVGLVVPERLHKLLAGQFGLPLYWNRPVDRIMDEEALIVEADCPVEHASQLAMSRAFHKLYDVVIITRDGKLAGAASIRSILESITALRTEAARTANPLTGLPGNEGIQRELQRRIASRMPFSVIYADLDFFKWYNDLFGFRRGDELIRYTADVLMQAVRQSGQIGDFVGHIGGDDFIVMTEMTDPETFCRRIIGSFDAGVRSFYDGSEVSSVTARDGSELEREGVTVSLSLTMWDGIVPVTPEYFSAISAKLKKQAKSVRGSAYIAERIGAEHQIELQLGVDQS